MSNFENVRISLVFQVNSDKSLLVTGRATQDLVDISLPTVNYYYSTDLTDDNLPLADQFSMSACPNVDPVKFSALMSQMIKVQQTFHDINYLVGHLVNIGMPLDEIESTVRLVYDSNKIVVKAAK